MSRWDNSNKFKDNGITPMLYQLCDAIYKQAGREGIMKTLAEVREKGITLSLENLYADGKGYDIAKKLSDALDKLPYDTIYGYRGSLISRLEVIKEERRTSVTPYPYPVKEKLTPAQQGLLDASDALFNAELLAFKEHNIRGLMHLGRPLALLRTIGVNAEEITLSPKILNRHLNAHGLSVDDLQGLARAIQTPILAYNHGLESMNKVLVSDIFVKGGKLSVSLQLDDNGKVVELNNVKSIHQKDAIEEIERLSYVGEDLKKLLLWVEKEKVMDWFSPVDLYSPIQASNPKLISVAKILKDFENPKIIEEKNDILEENSTKESFSSEMEGEIAADDMEKELHVSTVSSEEIPRHLIKNAIVERILEPSPSATFTKEQQELIIKFLKDYPSTDKKLQALLPLWQEVVQDRRVKGEPADWFTAVKAELNDLASGIRREPGEGLHLK